MSAGFGVLELAILVAVAALVGIVATSAAAARARGDVSGSGRPGRLRRWFIAGLGVGVIAGLVYAVWQLLADGRPAVAPFLDPIAGPPR